jgi:methylthioribose-1-phosphate isomerase
MKVGDKYYHSIWEKHDDSSTICIIDQRWLPFEFVIEELITVENFASAIKDMHLRGAPLIGVAGAYSMYIAALTTPTENVNDFVLKSANLIKSTRPTAVNLSWAVDKQLELILNTDGRSNKIEAALKQARLIAEEDVENCKKIGEYGVELIREISKKKNSETVNILTHCNAGWLATVDWGTATSPIYHAFREGLIINVWVDETRPLNQGSKLTAWELAQEGIPHTLIVDNAGGHLMQHGLVDLVIVGSDRTTLDGFVTNKIGTYLKALAAKDCGVPFYAALPASTLDWEDKIDPKNIPIEKRSPDEVKYMTGIYNNQRISLLTMNESSPARNYAFDVTPPYLVTGLITEKGICKADRESILGLFNKSEHDFKD